ncbi:MAG: phosphonate monoester hydrolase [Stappia sp.]|uniref:alkaline phosphatase family protein n=1 Tax=Stappia sp. TaxID=1870903 RepID=UPI000C35DC0D|nr:alkaline phosphatase family protein [Stappia sp.]MAA97532.1 phosphonate monoester hydrolase [Stappia sp.]MBM22065.1 phosphonate monoester hydrolase [Stappia sp.]
MLNVLLITADQWRGDCLGVAGHPVVRTPHIDALARDGVHFSRHYCQAAPCSPARACLYTGLYQMTNRVVRNGTPLDARHDTIALAARRAGYDPTLFGYTDQSVDPRTVTGDDPWLRTYEGILPGMSVRVRVPEDHGPWLSWLEARGHKLPDPPQDIWLPADGPADPPGGRPARYGEDDTETAFLVGEFLRWLGEVEGAPPARAKAGGRPWFAHLSFIRPHPPFIVPEPYASMYDPDAGPEFLGAATPEEAGAVHPFLAYSLDKLDKADLVWGTDGKARDWDEATRRRIRATYWGMVSEVDAQIGRVVAELKARGLYDNTLIVLTADHGEMMGDHQLFSKLGFYDQAYHIPLIVRDPRKPAHHGRTVEAFSESVDIMPTVLEAIGAKCPTWLDGRALTPFLDGETPADWREAVHWEYDFREVASGEAEAKLGLPIDLSGMSVIRDADVKYVHFAGLPPLLFDLETDPGETRNVADDPAYLSVRLHYAEKMLAWRTRHLDRRLTGIELTEDGPVDGRER